MMSYYKLAYEALNTKSDKIYSYNEFEELLNSVGDKQQVLRKQSREIMEIKDVNKLFVRGCIEFSNICDNCCAYCGMSSANDSLKRYTMTVNEILSCVDVASDLGIKQIHLVSGENKNVDINMLCEVVKSIVRRGMSATLVLGELDEYKYKKLYDCGASRYIIKFETSNQNVYRLHKGNDGLIKRVSNLFLLRDIGYKIGTGNIIGLPYTDSRDLYNDLQLLYNIDPDMASSSVFTPNPQSKLRNYPSGNKQNAINYITMIRNTLKKVSIIPSSSALGFDNQKEALLSGSNLVSCHLTPAVYSKGFSMYDGEDRNKTQMETIKRLGDLVGMEISEYV